MTGEEDSHSRSLRRSDVAGSLMFAPDICVPALRAMLVKYGKKICGRYGFADAFNPSTGWVSRYVLGIDARISLLSAENLRTGKVWQWFMSNPAPEGALDIVGLVNKQDGGGEDLGVAASATPGADGKPGTYPEILVTRDPMIPVSTFRYKIPIPALWTRGHGIIQTGSSRAFSQHAGNAKP